MGGSVHARSGAPWPWASAPAAHATTPVELNHHTDSSVGLRGNGPAAAKLVHERGAPRPLHLEGIEQVPHQHQVELPTLVGSWALSAVLNLGGQLGVEPKEPVNQVRSTLVCHRKVLPALTSERFHCCK